MHICSMAYGSGALYRADYGRQSESVEMCQYLFVYFNVFFLFFFNWYSLHARLSSHYEEWSYKNWKHKKVKAYRKSI